MGRTLDRYVYEYLDGRRDRGEIVKDTYNEHLYRLMRLSDSHGNYALTRFGPAVIDKWLRSINQTQAEGSRRNSMLVVKAFCRWMVSKGYVVKNPCAEMKLPRVPRSKPRSVEPSAIDQLFEVLPNKRAEVIIWLMFSSGLRCVEVSNLDVEHINWTEMKVFVTGKGGHQREVFIATGCAEAIRAYLRESGHRHGPLIQSKRYNRRMGAAPISKLVSGWLADAGVHQRGLDRSTAHALRHTAATTLFDITGDLRDVQDLLGHASLQTTNIYIGNRKNEARIRAGLEQGSARYRRVS